jgi:hypothetical protein
MVTHIEVWAPLLQAKHKLRKVKIVMLVQEGENTPEKRKPSYACFALHTFVSVL